MNDFAIARALPVVAVVAWLGGVAMETTVLLAASDATILGAVAGAHGGWWLP